MLSPTAASSPSTPSSLYSTPHSIASDGPGSFSVISLPPTHESEKNSESLTSSLSTLRLSPSSRQSIAATDSSKGSSPATLSPPVTRSPSPPQDQEDQEDQDQEDQDQDQEDQDQDQDQEDQDHQDHELSQDDKPLPEKKSWRPLAGASEVGQKSEQVAKTRKSASTSMMPIPVTAPIDPPYLLPYAQMAPCVLLPNGQFVVINPLEWAHMTTDTSGAFAQIPISSPPQQPAVPLAPSLPVPYQASHKTSDTSASVSTPSVGVAAPLMEVPTYVQPMSAWPYDYRPYFVPQMVDGYPAMNGRRRVRPGFCLFIFHLPPETVDEELFHLFSQYGTVFSAKVIRDKSTQDSKGYGFVNMATEQQADYAIERLNGSRYKNKYLKVSYKKKKNYTGKSPR